MALTQLVIRFVLLVAMIAGGIAAWRMPKREGRRGEAQAWRDTSLDDWRRERDEAAEAQRRARMAESDDLATGSRADEGDTGKPHQRIGG